LPAAGPRRVSDVNFRRGPRGQGVVTIKLSAPGIPVDVRQEGNRLIADFQGAALPRGQERRLDVSDFATPVMTIEALNVGNNARMSIQPTPPFEYLAYQADDLYVIEVSPPEKSAEELEREARLDPTRRVYTGDLLSLNFQDIEVRAILQILADFTGLNIVVSDSVTGNLTLRLQNVPWDQALDIIMRTKGLSSRQSGNVVFIAPTEEITARERLDLESRRTVEELIPLRTEIISVNYAKAADLAALLKTKGEQGQSVLSPRGDVAVDERTNSLIVKDVPDTLVEVRELVAALDQPTRQVLIDSRVVIASDDFSRDLGVRFGVTGVRETGQGLNALGGTLGGTDQIIGSAVDNLTSTGQPFPVAVPELADRLGVNFPVGGPSLALAILGSNYLVDLELSALQVEGRGEVLSNPRVVTADMQEAKILQGQTVDTIIRGADQDATFTTDAFLELTVTPQITPDDRIMMNLLVTKNDISASSDTRTVTDKREVKTQVLVNNSETVVLGGVFEQNKREGQEKVPLLGDIPLLGYLFRTTSRSTSKRELLIFVTPQILRDGSLAER
jgi:type IV pilus assembly protein PilQ